MKQLGGQDASFLYLETEGAHLHLTAFYVYEQAADEHLNFEDVLRHVNSRLNTANIFRQKLVRPRLDLDYPHWVDDENFDLSQHVHRYRGPAPANRQALYDLVARLHSEPLDLSRPPWDMLVIESMGTLEDLPENCFAVIARYHHAAIDGASGSQLVDGLHDIRPTDIQDVAGKSWVPESPPGTPDILLRAVFNNLRGPARLVKTLAGALPAIAGSVFKPSNECAEQSRTVPSTRFNRRVGRDRVFHSVSLDLDTMRFIRTSVDGATVNDVILTICGGALREWLEARKELPDESLVAMVPVNARSSDEKSLGGNKLATLFVPIHTDISNSMDRLRAIRMATRLAKAEATEPAAQDMSQIPNHLPAMTLSATSQLFTALGLGYRAMTLCNCTITNVPGPQKTLFLGPAKLVFSSGCAPILDGMGLLISAFTYQGQVTFSFTSCPDMLPDAASLAECAERVFNELSQTEDS